MKIFAHRGASAYAPENTLESFALAAKMGPDWERRHNIHPRAYHLGHGGRR